MAGWQQPSPGSALLAASRETALGHGVPSKTETSATRFAPIYVCIYIIYIFLYIYIYKTLCYW